MKIQGETIIGPDGSIAIRTTNGTFVTGSALLKQIARRMAEQGLQLSGEFVPEQHRHDDPDQMERERQRAERNPALAHLTGHHGHDHTH